MNSTTRTARTIRTAAVTAAALVIGLLAAGGNAEAAGWQYHDINRDGRYDTATFDINADGNNEHVYFDTDHNGSWDIYLYATGNWTMFRVLASNALIWNLRAADANWVYVDAQGNGLYETLGYDSNRDGVNEYVSVDSNGDGSYDSGWYAVGGGTTWTPYGSAVKTVLDIWMTAANNRMVDIWL